MSTLAVYDCMLFFRAASRPDRVRPIFELVHQGKVTLCFSPEVLAEIRDVLTRPSLIAKYPALTPQAVDAYLAQHLRGANWITDVPEHFVLSRDPKDSKYLNLAISAGARYVVTTDRDLLDLMSAQEADALDFRTRFPSVSNASTRLRSRPQSFRQTRLDQRAGFSRAPFCVPANFPGDSSGR